MHTFRQYVSASDELDTASTGCMVSTTNSTGSRALLELVQRPSRVALALRIVRGSAPLGVTIDIINAFGARCSSACVPSSTVAASSTGVSSSAASAGQRSSEPYVLDAALQALSRRAWASIAHALRSEMGGDTNWTEPPKELSGMQSWFDDAHPMGEDDPST